MRSGARRMPLLAEPDVRLWVDARDPDQEEPELLRKQFGLHPLSIEDALHWNQRSKVEIFEGYFAVVVHGLDGHLTIVERLEDLSDDVEDRVFHEDGEMTAQQEIFRPKRRVVAFHRIVVPLREVVVMKKVSSWAAIVLVPTLIAGIYGMNSRHMLELAWQYGYPLSLGTMLVAPLLLYRGFAKRGWL
jgi:Mg2+ and Co2+ transporter CorA